MSVIRTKDGWVELGANNTLERAYETSGGMGMMVEDDPELFDDHKSSTEIDRGEHHPNYRRVRCPLHAPRVMRAKPLDTAAILDGIARKVGIKW